MPQYNELLYRMEVARVQLSIASNQMMCHDSALMTIDEAMSAIEKTVAIICSQRTAGQVGHANQIIPIAHLPVSL